MTLWRPKYNTYLNLGVQDFERNKCVEPAPHRLGERNMFAHTIFLLSWVATAVQCTNIVLSNDDGWAVAQIRAQNNALEAAGFNVRADVQCLLPPWNLTMISIIRSFCPRLRRTSLAPARQPLHRLP